MSAPETIQVSSPIVPPTEKVTVCNTLNGLCQEVTLQTGRKVLENAERAVIPVKTTAGVQSLNVIIVRNETDAKYYGVM